MALANDELRYELGDLRTVFFRICEFLDQRSDIAASPLFNRLD